MTETQSAMQPPSKPPTVATSAGDDESWRVAYGFVSVWLDGKLVRQEIADWKESTE